jgi:hypothetical protein
MRIWLRALGAFVAITLIGILMDRLLLTEGVPRFDLLLVSNALVGGAAAALVFVLAVRGRQRAAFVSSRMRVIAEMNHHIRNALQVIQYTSLTTQSEAEMTAMKQAVQRITWALREVLPQMLHEEDEFEERGFTAKREVSREHEYRRPPAVGEK